VTTPTAAEASARLQELHAIELERTAAIRLSALRRLLELTRQLRAGRLTTIIEPK
jgi:hypothetical protein